MPLLTHLSWQIPYLAILGLLVVVARIYDHISLSKAKTLGHAILLQMILVCGTIQIYHKGYPALKVVVFRIFDDDGDLERGIWSVAIMVLSWLTWDAGCTLHETIDFFFGLDSAADDEGASSKTDGSSTKETMDTGTEKASETDAIRVAWVGLFCKLCTVELLLIWVAWYLYWIAHYNVVREIFKTINEAIQIICEQVFPWVF